MTYLHIPFLHIPFLQSSSLFFDFMVRRFGSICKSYSVGEVNDGIISFTIFLALRLGVLGKQLQKNVLVFVVMKQLFSKVHE